MTLGDVCEAPVCGVLQGRNPTIGPPLRHLAEAPTLHARMLVITRRKATESLACADANDLSTFSSYTAEDYPLLLGNKDADQFVLRNGVYTDNTLSPLRRYTGDLQNVKLHVTKKRLASKEACKGTMQKHRNPCYLPQQRAKVVSCCSWCWQ